MNPSSTNVEERDKWRAKINRALSELQTDAPHIDGRTRDESENETASMLTEV